MESKNKGWKMFFQKILSKFKKKKELTEYKVLLPYTVVRDTEWYWDDYIRVYDTNYVFYVDKYDEDELKLYSIIYTPSRFPFKIVKIDKRNKVIKTKMA